MRRTIDQVFVSHVELGSTVTIENVTEYLLLRNVVYEVEVFHHGMLDGVETRLRMGEYGSNITCEPGDPPPRVSMYPGCTLWLRWNPKYRTPKKHHPVRFRFYWDDGRELWREGA